VSVGVLPTLRESDLHYDAMTQTARFRALSAALQRLRGQPFQFRIHGEEPLDVSCDDVTLEGAATSLQVHLRASSRAFDDVFNAMQLATTPLLAVAGNSPIFLGHKLWEETGLALFKQEAIDRDMPARRRHRAPRVSYWVDWVRDGAIDVSLRSDRPRRAPNRRGPPAGARGSGGCDAGDVGLEA
jgi:hypothetical protein